MAHLLIVEARFYSHLNDMLIDGVRSALEAEGHSHETVTVPGALEVPAAISLAAETGRYDAYVALGVVIRGETYHFEVVSNESARGIMALTLDGLAIGNGILTVEDEDQALARADKTRKDKGGEAAKAALAMLALKENSGLLDRPPPSRFSVVERGGRLVVIDRETGTTPLSAAERMAEHDRRMANAPPRPARRRSPEDVAADLAPEVIELVIEAPAPPATPA